MDSGQARREPDIPSFGFLWYYPLTCIICDTAPWLCICRKPLDMSSPLLQRDYTSRRPCLLHQFGSAVSILQNYEVIDSFERFRLPGID